MNHLHENPELSGQPETEHHGQTAVDQLRSSRSKQIAALLFIASTLGCGARSELKIDENSTIGQGGDGGTGGSDTGAGGTDTGGAGGEGGEGGSPPLECNKVSIIFDGPASATVPKAATNVPVFCFHVKNGCVKGMLETMTFETEGVSDHSTVEFAFAYTDGLRMTEFQTGSSAEPSHTFKNIHLPLAADAENALVCLYANFSKTAFPGGQYRFKYFPKKEDFSNGAALEGVPESITGNTFTMGGITGGSVIVNASVIPLPSLLSGQNGSIASFNIMEDGTEDGGLNRASLHLGGTCDPSKISNFALYDGSTVVCAGPEISLYPNGDVLKIAHLTCASPLLIGKATTKTLTLKADQTCPPGTFIETSLAHPSDLFVKGTTFGFGESVSGYDGKSGSGSYSHVDIK